MQNIPPIPKTALPVADSHQSTSDPVREHDVYHSDFLSVSDTLLIPLLGQPLHKMPAGNRSEPHLVSSGTAELRAVRSEPGLRGSDYLRLQWQAHASIGWKPDDEVRLFGAAK